jgi:ABC-2 type transport system ATP-binding protein
MASVIKITNLVKYYKRFKAIDRISLEVEEGEIFGFLGPNGAGKTTTIQVLCTLLKPTSGSAFINGYDCFAQPAQVRSCIGLVFQELILDDELTAEENLRFHCYLYGLWGKVIPERIQSVLRLVDLEDRQHDRVKKYSWGMKRRLEIARGLLHYPKVLFLDEPTTGLDPQTRYHIWEFIASLQKKEPITIFLTTHYMEEAEICNRIAVIDKGKIIALGTPAELKKLLAGDIIEVKTRDNQRVWEFWKDKDLLDLTQDNNTLWLKVKDAEEFLPHFIRESPAEIQYLNIKKPTLNDVFLHLTGKEIRPEEGGIRETWRKWRQAARR